MNSLNDFKLNYEPLKENKKYLRSVHYLPSRFGFRYRTIIRLVAVGVRESFKDAVRRAGWVIE